MDVEIQEVIKKNLPAQVGEVLKKRLEQADNFEVKISQLEETLGYKNAEITSQRNRLDDYRKFDERNSQLEKREKEVAEKELN